MNNNDLAEVLSYHGYEVAAEAYRKIARNAIVINDKGMSNESDFHMGESKLGGIPHLPPEIPFPEYANKALLLLAQFNLADLAKFDIDCKLPHSGMLYFFYSDDECILSYKEHCHYIEERMGFIDSNNRLFKVIWYNGDLSELRPVTPTKPYGTICHGDDFDPKPRKVDFSTELQYPHHFIYITNFEDIIGGKDYYDSLVQRFGKEEANRQWDEIDKITSDGFYGSYCDHLLGYGKHCQPNEIDDDTELFQYTDDRKSGLYFGDMANIHFGIDSIDLANGIFDNSSCLFECS